ncbi:putative beta-lysine N-acetyltransferase [Metallumcola ferriviriculae]|uniref:Beta-lysine N-acetyltransferase n=1 Tax=Metallumcola ferriviriculae TaxID=3039180 RepID=A0AAU0UMY3_9FIRM|nr:putative beta-lysine N-acetyltransferase [Desulfitibacteraceae bacterium MK1]
MNNQTVFINDKEQVSFFGDAYGFSWTAEDDRCSLNVYLDFPNERLKVLDYDGDADAVSQRLMALGRKNQVSKILFNVSANWQEFSARGFIKEGEIPGYFNGETAHCLSYFLSEERRRSPFVEEEKSILDKVLAEAPNFNDSEDKYTSQWDVVTGSEEYAPELAEFYDGTFKTYPTPLNDPEYVKQIMDNHVEFLLVLDEGKIISSASAERNFNYNNAEMTDCATSPDYRGRGLMRFILDRLGEDMQKKGLQVIYSLARARSTGMNMVFRKLGYDFKGQFIKNCHICGKFEDMNLWVKVLSQKPLS